LEGECLVEADSANLLTHGTADNVGGSTLCEESGRSDSDSEGSGLSSVNMSDAHFGHGTQESMVAATVWKRLNLLSSTGGRGRSSSDCVSGHSDDLGLIGRDHSDSRGESVGKCDHLRGNRCSGGDSDCCEGCAKRGEDSCALGARHSNRVLLTNCRKLANASFAAGTCLAA
jgi:hypothetical protein